jgi:hypothetical protein
VLRFCATGAVGSCAPGQCALGQTRSGLRVWVARARGSGASNAAGVSPFLATAAGGGGYRIMNALAGNCSDVLSCSGLWVLSFFDSFPLCKKLPPVAAFDRPPVPGYVAAWDLGARRCWASGAAKNFVFWNRLKRTFWKDAQTLIQGAGGVNTTRLVGVAQTMYAIRKIFKIQDIHSTRWKAMLLDARGSSVRESSRRSASEKRGGGADK